MIIQNTVPLNKESFFCHSPTKKKDEDDRFRRNPARSEGDGLFGSTEQNVPLASPGLQSYIGIFFRGNLLLLLLSSSSSSSSPPLHIISCCMNYDFFHAIRARHVNVDSAAVHCGFGGKRVISLYLILPCLVSVVTLLHFTSLLCSFASLCLSCDAYCWAVCALWLAWYLLLLGRLNVCIVPTPWLTWLWEEQATNFKIAFSLWAVKGWSKAILFSLCCINLVSCNSCKACWLGSSRLRLWR